ADHRAAQRPHQEADGEDAEGRQDLRHRILGREERPPDLAGEVAVDREVVPFEHVADHAGGDHGGVRGLGCRGQGGPARTPISRRPSSLRKGSAVSIRATKGMAAAPAASQAGASGSPERQPSQVAVSGTNPPTMLQAMLPPIASAVQRTRSGVISAKSAPCTPNCTLSASTKPAWPSHSWPGSELCISMKKGIAPTTPRAALAARRPRRPTWSASQPKNSDTGVTASMLIDVTLKVSAGEAPVIVCSHS